MNTYTVRAKKWRHGWELHIDGEGVTQTRALANARAQVRDYLALEHDLDDEAAAALDIVIVPTEDKTLVAALKDVRQGAADLIKRQAAVADKSRTVVRSLKDKGYKGADIAALLDVTPQRVSQLTKANKVKRNVGTSSETSDARVAAAAGRSAAGKQVKPQGRRVAGSAAARSRGSRAQSGR